MRAFLASLKKNFKNLFRNWASLFLVVIGPLLLMGVIFAAFSDIGFSNVRIGYVVEQPEKIASFLDSISYVGAFIRYDSLEACQDRLKRQQAHACLDVHLVGDRVDIDVYVDNTREIISYVLYGQIHRAMISERQNLIINKVESSFGRLRGMGDFIVDTQRKLSDTSSMLSQQKTELQNTLSELSQARSKIDEKQRRLRGIKDDLRVQREIVTDNVEDLYRDATFALEQSRLVLDSVRNQLVSLGLDTSLLSPGYSVISEQQNKVNNAMNDFNSQMARIDSLIREIDAAITELDEAKRFIDTTASKIQSGMNRIDVEQRNIRDYKTDLESRRQEILEIVNNDVRSFSTPIETNFNELFSGSARAKRLALDVDLTSEQKARLLNFGSIQTLLPFILSITLCFISVILANIITLDEIHSAAFTRNALARGTRLARTLALFTTIFITSFVQVLIILVLGYVVFFLDINVMNVLIPLILLISIYAILGMIIAYVINDKSTSLLVSAFIMIINLFLSGTVYPVERMSSFMEYVAKMIPFTSGISMLQQGIFYGVPLSDMWAQLLTLIVILSVLIVCLALAKAWFMKKKLCKG